MALEPENTTEETDAGNGIGGDVSAAASDPNPAGTGEVAVEAEAKPDDATKAAEEAAIKASADADIAARLDAIFENDKAEGKAEISAAMLTDESLAKLPPDVRAVVRWAAAEKARNAADLKAREEKITAAQAEMQRRLDEGARELRRQRLNLQSLVNTGVVKKVAEGPPRVDPTTPEGMRAIATYEAQKGLAEALKPFADDKARAERESAYDRLKDSYPELQDPKIEAQFADFLRKENEGIDPTKQAPRVNAVIGARMFTAELRAKNAADTARVARDNAAADRAPAATLLNRRTTGASGNQVRDIPKDIWEAGGDTLTHYLAQLTPEERGAIRKNLGRSAAA